MSLRDDPKSALGPRMQPGIGRRREQASALTLQQASTQACWRSADVGGSRRRRTWRAAAAQKGFNPRKVRFIDGQEAGCCLGLDEHRKCRCPADRIAGRGDILARERHGFAAGAIGRHLMFDVQTGRPHYSLFRRAHAARPDGKGAGAQGEQEPKRYHRYLPKRPVHHDAQALAPKRASIKAHSVDPRATIENAAGLANTTCCWHTRPSGRL